MPISGFLECSRKGKGLSYLKLALLLHVDHVTKINEQKLGPHSGRKNQKLKACHTETSCPNVVTATL
jgi:hypothetical protein